MMDALRSAVDDLKISYGDCLLEPFPRQVDVRLPCSWASGSASDLPGISIMSAQVRHLAPMKKTMITNTQTIQLTSKVIVKAMRTTSAELVCARICVRLYTGKRSKLK